MEGGRRVGPRVELEEMRERRESDLASLDDGYKALKGPAVYPVGHSDGLERLRQETEQELRAKAGVLAHEGRV